MNNPAFQNRNLDKFDLEAEREGQAIRIFRKQFRPQPGNLKDNKTEPKPTLEQLLGIS